MEGRGQRSNASEIVQGAVHQGRNWALALREMGATEGSAESEQPTQGPISDKGAAGLLPRGPLWRGLVQGCGTPIVTSPGSPGSIWNPAF